MIKKFFNVFKTNKSKLTMEELEICSSIVNKALKIFVISMIIMAICIILSSKDIFIGILGTVAAIMFCTSLAIITFGADTDLNIQKLEEVKKYDLKAKNIINLIKEGKFDKIYCVDKDINKLLFDISLEKRNIEITIKEGNIVVTADGMEIPLAVDNVNDYFGMY